MDNLIIRKKHRSKPSKKAVELNEQAISLCLRLDSLTDLDMKLTTLRLLNDARIEHLKEMCADADLPIQKRMHRTIRNLRFQEIE